MTHTLSRRSFAQLSGAAVVMSLVSHSPVGVAAQGDRPLLRFATNAADLGNLDPQFASATTDRTVVAMIFNGLIRYAPGDSSSFEPDIAEEMPTPTENEDGTQSWSFTIRDGVMTHDTPEVPSYALTSDDILFSYEKVSNPDTSGYATEYDGWTFEAPDERTFVMTVPSPLSEQLFLPRVADYAGGYIIPRQPYEALGADEFVTRPIGTSAFRFESHTPQNNVALAAHDGYWRGEPQLSGVEVRYIPDNTSRELALQSGDIHLMYGFPEAPWVERMDAMDGITARAFGVGEVMFLHLDTEHEILQDPLVREAICLAIDRNNHLALVGEPVAVPIYSLIPEDMMDGGLSEEEATEAGVKFEHDLDRARELLAEAGHADGFELQLITSEMDEYRMNYEVLAEELRQIDINVTLDVVQHAAMHELIREGRNAIVFYVAFRPTPDTYFTQFFTTDGGVTNFSNFTVDDLRDQARAELDGNAQAQLWKDANIEILSNFAGYPLMYKNIVYAWQDSVDFGHELVSVVQVYPGIDETTSLGEQ